MRISRHGWVGPLPEHGLLLSLLPLEFCQGSLGRYRLLRDAQVVMVGDVLKELDVHGRGHCSFEAHATCAARTFGRRLLASQTFLP